MTELYSSVQFPVQGHLFESLTARRCPSPAVGESTVLDLRITTSQQCEAVPRRARI